MKAVTKYDGAMMFASLVLLAIIPAVAMYFSA